jgi:hypothetical protein
MLECPHNASTYMGAITEVGIDLPAFHSTISSENTATNFIATTGPLYGSWLNMAEIELAVLTRQCLQRPIGTPEQMRLEVSAWQRERNQAEVTID